MGIEIDQRDCDNGLADTEDKSSAVSAGYPSPSVEELIRLQRQYIEEIQPFIKVQANIMAIQPATWIRNGINGYDRRINWLPGSKESFDMAGQIIEEIGRKIFQRRDRKLKHGYNMYTSLTPVERVPELMPCNQDKG
jgi:hypothetical protein